MPLIIPANTLSGGYEVANSCLFGGTDNEYMSKTLGTPSSTKKMTWSFWTKKTRNENDGHIATVYGDGSNYGTLNWTDANKFQVFQYISGSIQLNLITEQQFRDNSAWSHFVIQMDTTQSTASDRCKVWHNGSRITDWATETYWAQDTAIKLNEASASLVINAITTGSQYHGYVAEFIMCDGQTYQASDFGEFDEDSPTIWKPKDPSDLTFGTNGFWLDFEDSANLGNDANGGTDLSETNFAATDQATDTPTNNFCTLNALDNYFAGSTFSEGNLKIVTSSGNYTFNTGTIGVAAGKWYWEVKVDSNSTEDLIGITKNVSTGTTNYLGQNTGAVGHNDNGNAYVAGSNNSYGTSYTTNDIIGVALDVDNNKLYFSKNGTFQNSGVPTSGSTGTGAISIDAISGDFYFPAIGEFEGSASGTFSVNFGSPSFAISSGNSDANGYGNFEYSVPTGYYALCTKNLAEFG